MKTQLIALPERAMDLAGKWGGEVMDMVPRVSQWLETGAKLGALKSGSKIAMKFVRRHPLATVATVAGAGALWYMAHKKAKEARNGDTIEGSARRVEAKRPARKTTRARKSTRRPTTSEG